jgi:ABC transport system ATP-binding/permease protein
LWKVFVRDRQGHDIGQVVLTGAPVTIGRDADRTLCLQSAAVSRRHARLAIDGGRVVVIDEGSANGVKVDGRRISVPTPVTMESRVEIAEFVIRVVLQGGSGEAAISSLALQARRSSPAQAVVVPPRGVAAQHYDVTAPFQHDLATPPPGMTTPLPGGGEAAATGTAPQFPARLVAARSVIVPVGTPRAGVPVTTAVTLSGALAAVQGAGVRLVGLGGPYDGRVFDLLKPEAFVGRVTGNDIILDDSSISRRHARLRLVDGGARLEVFDLRSANGTFINGERTRLDACGPGDKLRFGDLLFRVESTQLQPQSSIQPEDAPGRKWWAVVIGAIAFVLLATVIGAAVWKWDQERRTAPKHGGIRSGLLKLETGVGKGTLEEAQWKTTSGLPRRATM